MPTYTFNRPMADATRDTMANVTKTLLEQLRDLDVQCQSSLAEWSDTARDQYDDAKRQWDRAALRMPTSLGHAEKALNDITGGYLRVEHTGANQWGGYTVK